ncbi:MAG: helix-turn-helix domain-containing protein [Elusimicrobiota bacterium]|jgi:excisionase family DNA binding protein|nr:helix-turn-helix domain-containing protein [Elusimicrobiota bacterium]
MKQNFRADKCITYTINDVAEMLGVSRITIVRKVRKPGFIPAVNLGGAVKFIREDVWRWLEEQKEKTQERYLGIRESKTNKGKVNDRNSSATLHQ